MGEVPFGQEGMFRSACRVTLIEERLSDMMQVSKEDIRKGVTLSRELYPGAVEVIPSFIDED